MNAITAQTDHIERMLDVAVVRHRVIAQNIANVNTPGYRRLHVAFEDELARTLKAGTAGKPVQPQVLESPGGIERADGNNVDIDREMGQLTKNALLFNAFAQVMNSRLSQLRSAITGR